jgi:6,7-dimethyl-8-ribityllumazine synthase
MSEHTPTAKLDLAKNTFRIAIVQAEFNGELTDAQTASAQACAQEYGIPTEVFHVAGAFEIPQLIDQLALQKQFDGFVAIGCLIKGETTHFEVISQAASQGVMQVSLAHHVPVGFGIITALTIEQARARVAIGHDAMRAVLMTLSPRIHTL